MCVKMGGREGGYWGWRRGFGEVEEGGKIVRIGESEEETDACGSTRERGGELEVSRGEEERKSPCHCASLSTEALEARVKRERVAGSQLTAPTTPPQSHTPAPRMLILILQRRLFKHAK